MTGVETATSTQEGRSDKELMLSYDGISCWQERDAPRQQHEDAQAYMGIYIPYPGIDRLVCLRNNSELGLLNGAVANINRC